MRNDLIRVLIPYFGPWPFWMPAFLASCGANERVSWSIFGDHELPVAPPPNVHFERLSFSDYCALVSQRLQIRFAPSHPYKLCDLKPALGAVHRDHLEGSRFWAFSDIDLVYGDLLARFAPLLDRWDIISTHATRISGHFCILRTRQDCIDAFRQARSWREDLECPDHLFFDESAFSWRLLPHKNWPRWLLVLVYGRDRLIRNSRFAEEYTTPRAGARLPWLYGKAPLPTRWQWQRGTLQNELTGAREFPYFHFMDWKNTAWKGRNSSTLWQLDSNDLQNGFAITEKGFSPL